MSTNEGGAYIANIIPSNQFQSDIPLGSDKHYKLPKNLFSEKCNACLANLTRKKPVPVKVPEKPEEDDEDEVEVATEESTEVSTELPKRRRRHGHEQLNIFDHAAEPKSVDIFDGPLDTNSIYSGFVEVIVEHEDANDNKSVSIFGDTFPQQSPQAPVVTEEDSDQMLMAITYLLSGLIVLVISLFFLLCLLHRYQKKHIIQGNEVVSLTDSLRLLCHGGRANHHQHRSLNTVSKPPDLPPIQRDNLPQAYVDRHKDSDYGFQHEFELLPDRFTDRTSRSGDMKENIYKNRYPDIKCYDQTRVKLSTLNGMIGTDYINANFVIGYKERKKFICAQGPMDSTVTDFWRMIWEQHLEIIIMLTNLEEYNKTKCAKYWPERVGESVQFGEMTVSFESEQRYSDYLVRNIKVSVWLFLKKALDIQHMTQLQPLQDSFLQKFN
jgi:protein-tyrosine phosphatase